MEIANIKIGENFKPFIIAEIGQNHDGSLGIAHSYIDAMADVGVDAVKFQTHIADAESSRDDKFRVNFSYEDKARRDYWKRMEFTKEHWTGLYEHAVRRGLVFLSSPFSLEAAVLLEEVGCPAWKVGSGEVSNSLLLGYICKTKKPILLSSGMSSYEEIDTAARIIGRHGNPLALFQCTSQYPPALENVGLNVLEYLRNKYNVPVGLSDHSGVIFPSLFAMAMGASLIEAHVTFHRSMFGPDVASSLTLDELKILVDGSEAIEVLRANPVDKNVIAEDLQDMKELFEKSVGISRDLKKGTRLSKEMIKGLKPGTGIRIEDIQKVVGKKLTRDMKKNSILTWDDLM